MNQLSVPPAALAPHPSSFGRKAVGAFTALSVMALSVAAHAQAASTGDTAIDTAVSTGTTSLENHVGTWAPELITLAVIVAALTMAVGWVRKRA